MTESQASTIISRLKAKKFINSGNRKDIRLLITGKSKVESLQITIDYLVSRNAKREELIKECK